MGRCYWGDIEGKFWVAVQSSSDVENLVDIEPLPQRLVWHGCGCTVDFDEKNNQYCKNCYESLDVFLEEMGEDFDQEPYYEEEELAYELNEEHLDELNKNMEDLEKKIDVRIIEEFKKKKDEDMSNAYSGVFKQVVELIGIILKEKENMDLQVIARYGLGMQIKQSLEKNGSCAMYCEL